MIISIKAHEKQGFEGSLCLKTVKNGFKLLFYTST